MSFVEDPAFGFYGSWEAANQDCIERGLSTTNNTRMIQLLFASICACQVLFMASRAPRVTWEAVYLPVVETVLYGMASTGNGSMRLADGRMVPIARFCSWLITCPIMLFQVVGIHELKWRTISCKNMVMAASLIRTVFGIGASVTITPTMRWVQYFLSLSFFLFELIVVYQIFSAGLKKFGAVKTSLNNIVYSRIMFLRFLFFLSWSSFPIIWLLSSTGFCLVNEDVSVLAYLVADMICKNLYGITNANTLFRVLNGKWTPETEEEAKLPKDNEHAHVGETYFEQMLSGLRGSRRRDHDDHHDDHHMKEVRIDSRPITPGFHSPAADRAQDYGDRMRNKNPEKFVDDRDLPRLSSADRHRHSDHDRDFRGDRRGSQDDLRVVSEDYDPRGPSRGPAPYKSPDEDDYHSDRSRDDYHDERRSRRDRDASRDSYRDRGESRDSYRTAGTARDSYRDRGTSRDTYRDRSRDPREDSRGRGRSRDTR